jgi:glycosyltransferase involved in cell wall biosynthesis
MRILQVSHAFPPTFGGVESHVHDLAGRLVASGHEVTCLVGGQPREGDAAGSPRVLRAPCLTVSRLLSAQHRGGEALEGLRVEIATVLHDLLRTEDYDVVHVHNAHHFSPVLARAVLGTGVPAMNTVHDRVGEHLHPDVLDLPWAHVTYVSHYLEEALPSRRDSSVYWLGIDLDRFAPNGPMDPRLAALPGSRILHPARLLRWKGLHVSIAALAMLVERGVDASLILCGSTEIVDDKSELARYRMELEQLADDLVVRSRVHFEVFDRGRIDEAYRSADLVWYPTVEPEPLGLVPLEAMATGTPVVCSDTGGMRETVIHGATGLRVPPGDPEALAVASQRVLQDGELRERLVAGGVRRARVFDLHSYVARVEELYEQVRV